jgi:hypothetical protein
MSRRFLATALALAVALPIGLWSLPTALAAPPELTAAAKPLRAEAALPTPDTDLPAGWRGSSDVLVTAAGDATGVHLYRARERDAFAWTTLATLNAGMAEGGRWMGTTCVTGSGRYAVAVYAPTTAANRPALMNGGGLVAVVDVATGAVRRVPVRVQLAYYNPACGPGDKVLLTRATELDQQRTDLVTLDAATARVTGTRHIEAQLTTPAPGPDGDYGIARGSLVKVDAKGELRALARPAGQPFALRSTGRGALDLLTVQGERAVAYRYTGGRGVKLGDAPRTDLELAGLSGGRNALVGNVRTVATKGVPDLVALSAPKPAAAVSHEGHLLALQVSSQAGKDTVAVRVQSTRTGKASSGTVTTKRLTSRDGVATGRPGPGALAVDDPAFKVPNPPATGLPTCLIPRNSIKHQVLQPSANQVEWAVDLAVQGRLTVQRPANYLKTGMPAYTPQGMFQLPNGSPRVPAQLLLAVLAQETNLAQGSWHGVPGDIVNPLISDYYGLRVDTEAEIEKIRYSSADCGYGISQVTDGMRSGTGSGLYSEAQRVAIATDYAANIAAGLRILVDKWNQLQAADTRINNDDPQYIENWYLAVWGYNSGIYPRNGTNPYGVGWFNNPANPSYPANREPFLRGSLDDASHPGRWTYPEKIMGWAEHPQWQWIDPIDKYAKPIFGADAAERLSLPGRYQFCGPVNNCSDSQPANPCPAVNSSCWWHGYTTWLESNGPAEFARENLIYAVGSPEPALIRVYPAACTPYSSISGTLIVDDLTNSADNALCPGQVWGGKFTLRIGYPSGYIWTDYAQVDVHQIAGFLGHAWFTHAYDPDVTYAQGGTANNYHRAAGTWTPNITVAGNYDIVVHLMSHGANAVVDYIVNPNDGTGLTWPCRIDQGAFTNGQDAWVHLGATVLHPGARVQMNNLVQDATGTVDVGYDAIAFVPRPTGGHACRQTG